MHRHCNPLEPTSHHCMPEMMPLRLRRPKSTRVMLFGRPSTLPGLPPLPSPPLQSGAVTCRVPVGTAEDPVVCSCMTARMVRPPSAAMRPGSSASASVLPLDMDVGGMEFDRPSGGGGGGGGGVLSGGFSAYSSLEEGGGGGGGLAFGSAFDGEFPLDSLDEGDRDGEDLLRGGSPPANAGQRGSGGSLQGRGPAWVSGAGRSLLGKLGIRGRGGRAGSPDGADGRPLSPGSSVMSGGPAGGGGSFAPPMVAVVQQRGAISVINAEVHPARGRGGCEGKGWVLRAPSPGLAFVSTPSVPNPASKSHTHNNNSNNCQTLTAADRGACMHRLLPLGLGRLGLLLPVTGPGAHGDAV
jgi:hypothetical protein